MVADAVFHHTPDHQLVAFHHVARREFAVLSDSGMVDIHDRRPLVLSPEMAREWIDPGLSPVRAEEIARKCSRPTVEFEWFTVSKAVGNVRNQGPELIEPEFAADLFDDQ